MTEQFNVLKDKETVFSATLDHIARDYKQKNLKSLVFRHLKKHAKE